MAEEQQTTPTTSSKLTLDGLTGPAAYQVIRKAYGLPLTWDTFVRTLTFPSGGAHLTACQLLAWCLSWYNVNDGEKPAFFGEVPYLDSKGRARDWNVTDKQMRTARETVSHAGLVTFESKQRSCLVHVHWDAVADAVRREAEFRQSLKGPSNDFRHAPEGQSNDFRHAPEGQSESRHAPEGQSKTLRHAPEGQSERLDTPCRYNTLLHRSPSYLPPSPAEPEEEGESNAVRVARMLEYGRKAGRSCRGTWVKDAYAAFDAIVAGGKDPDIVEAAWCEYVDEKGASATDLGHWLRGHDMHDEEVDEEEWAFTACYERAAHRAEREREAAGGLPKPNLVHTPNGWIETRKSLMVADRDATREEAEAAWPEVWRRSQAS